MLKKVILLFGVASLVCAAFAFKPDQYSITYIDLQNRALKVTPKEFFITEVVDDRTNLNAIGILQPYAVKNGPKVTAAYMVDIKGGFAAVKNFISYALPVNKTYRPIIVRLKNLKVTETPVSGGMVKGDIDLSMAFYMAKSEEPVHLVDYTTTVTYQRKPGAAQQIEPLIGNAFSNSLLYLNNWMNDQAATNVKLAKGVQINFTEYSEPEEGDTIYYKASRPLKWADFEGKKRPGSRNAAEVFAGLGYDQEAKITNGIINVTLSMKVYAPKSACWKDLSDLSDYNLSHEQHHFDIARLVAEHFKQKILAARLTPDSYEGIINVTYIDALREMGNMQKQYDAETAHSANRYQQQLWNTRIEKELAEIGVHTKAT